MKFKTTLEIVYEIPDDKLEEYYNTTIPEEAAEIDRSKFDNDLGALIEMVQSNEFTLTIEPVK